MIIPLTAAGLKIREPFNRKTWRYSTRMLVITMPLTIALVALFGWAMLGFAPATAMLLGAVIAPTDPLLASDIQTTPPDQDDFSSARLALTTEAGLNDVLAFPFTNMAIAMTLMGAAPGPWFSAWLFTDVFYKIVVGVLVGGVAGWVIAKLIFLCPESQCHNSIIAFFGIRSIGSITICSTLFIMAVFRKPARLSP